MYYDYKYDEAEDSVECKRHVKYHFHISGVYERFHSRSTAVGNNALNVHIRYSISNEEWRVGRYNEKLGRGTYNVGKY